MVDAAVTEKPTVKPEIKKPELNIDRKLEPKAKDSQLSMQPDGHRCARMEFWLSPDCTIEDALKPEFWSQVAHKFMRPIATEGTYAGSVIEVRYPDMSMYAELFVRVVQKSSLVVSLVGEPQYFGPREVKSDAFEVRWNVGRQGYDILRKKDREIVADGSSIKTREQAQDWIKKTAG